DRLVLAAFDPRLGSAIQDVEDLDVGMRVQRRLVAGLRRLDAGADGRRALVVADDQLVVGQRAEADALRLSESNHRGLFHGETLRWRKSVTSGQARSAECGCKPSLSGWRKPWFASEKKCHSTGEPLAMKLSQSGPWMAGVAM